MDPLSTLRTVGRGVVNAHRLAKRFDDDLQHHRGKERFIHAWSRGIFPILGVDLTVVAGERPRALGPFVIIANHRSPLDILVAVHLVGGVVLSHHGVMEIPVIGDAARYTDTVFVDREDGKSGARAIRTLRRRLKEGRNVVVFPEGTTFAGDEVRPFKRGAFTAARGLSEVRVLPLGVAYRPGDEFVDESFGRYSSRMARRARTPIWATIGEPRPLPRTPADEETLRARVQELVGVSARARDTAPDR